MHNVTAEVKGDKLIVTMDMSKAAREGAPTSASGKTKLVATTGAAMGIPLPTGSAGSLTFACNLMFKP